MKILVTGGAGYLGTTMVPMLLEDDYHQITVLDLFPQGQPFFAGLCPDPCFTLIRGDIRDERVMADLIPKHDVIINLAAVVGAPACDRVGTEWAWGINVLAPWSMTKHLSPNQLMLQPTSDSGYGVGYEANVCTEEHALNPTSLYARSKVAAERSVIDAGGVSLRLASVFGMSPRMRIDLIVNEFVWRALNDKSVVLFEGHFRRNFVHVRDVAWAFIHAINLGEKMRGNVFNCGNSSQMMTKLQLCQEIAKEVPGFQWYEAEGQFDPDRRDFVVSNEKLEATGWEADYTVADGIRELIKGYTMLSNRGCFHA